MFVITFSLSVRIIAHIYDVPPRIKTLVKDQRVEFLSNCFLDACVRFIIDTEQDLP